MKRQHWKRKGRFIIRTPYWRSDRKSWFVSARDVRTGQRSHRRLDVEGGYRNFHGAKKEAERLVDEWLNNEEREEERKKRGQEQARKLKFEEAVELFLSYKASHCRANTIQEYRCILENVFGPHFHDMLLEDIESLAIEDVINKKKRYGKPITEKGKGNLKAVCHCLFAWLQKHGKVSRNPCKAVTVGNQSPQKEPVILEPEEAQELLDILKTARPRFSENLQVFTTVSLYSGLRPTTVTRLQWQDVNFKEGTLNVPGHKMKKGRSFWTVLHDDLREYLRALQKKRLKEGSGGLKADYIISCHTGTLRHPAKRAFRLLAERAEEPQRADELRRGYLRSFRQTFACLLDSEVSYSILRRLLAHSSAGRGFDVTVRYSTPRGNRKQLVKKLREAVHRLPPLLPKQGLEKRGKKAEKVG